MGASPLGNSLGYRGCTLLVDIATGGVIQKFDVVSHPSYPLTGIENGCYYDGHLYGSFMYSTWDDQENHRGMVDLNLDTGTIVYHQPTWEFGNSGISTIASSIPPISLNNSITMFLGKSVSYRGVAGI